MRIDDYFKVFRSNMNSFESEGIERSNKKFWKKKKFNNIKVFGKSRGFKRLLRVNGFVVFVIEKLWKSKLVEI